MTDRLSEIEERLAAATPGPWEAFPLEGNLEGPNGRVAEVGMWKDADAALIAHAPADLAALVAFARAVKEYVTTDWREWEPDFDPIRDLLSDLEQP